MSSRPRRHPKTTAKGQAAETGVRRNVRVGHEENIFMTLVRPKAWTGGGAIDRSVTLRFPCRQEERSQLHRWMQLFFCPFASEGPTPSTHRQENKNGGHYKQNRRARTIVRKDGHAPRSRTLRRHFSARGHHDRLRDLLHRRNRAAAKRHEPRACAARLARGRPRHAPFGHLLCGARAR